MFSFAWVVSRCWHAHFFVRHQGKLLEIWRRLSVNVAVWRNVCWQLWWIVFIVLTFLNTHLEFSVSHRMIPKFLSYFRFSVPTDCYSMMRYIHITKWKVKTTSLKTVVFSKIYNWHYPHATHSNVLHFNTWSDKFKKTKKYIYIFFFYLFLFHY